LWGRGENRRGKLAQDYKLTSFEKSDFQDNFGNYWCNAAFEGVSEPVRWVVKDPASVEVGKVYYGEIKDATSKAGKAYLRFHREKKEDAQPSHSETPKQEWQPRDDSHIRAQWAIGQAVSALVALNTDGKLEYGVVEDIAKKLFAMVDRVKGSSESTDPKANTPALTEKPSATGITAKTSDAVYDVPEGEPFSLDDIPF
jgi:hypothetical protein